MRHTMTALPVVRYFIGDDDEGAYQANDPTDFNETRELLKRLREESPETQYTLVAEIDA